MDRAVGRLFTALLTDEPIAIYGDADVDGITGTVLLVEGLSRLKAKVIPYMPSRKGEGYGLSFKGINRLYEQGVKLIITVDCGITAIEEVSFAAKKGIDLIITDHHSVIDQIPRAISVINPRRKDSSYPYADLAGVGVAFKLLQAFYKSLGRDEEVQVFGDLVTLGTVADMMPLTGENRYLVKKGLDILNKTERTGIQQLFMNSGLKPGDINTGCISWVIGPRINAAGRLDDVYLSYQLLTTSDVSEARRLATVLEEHNRERQRLTEQTLSSIKEHIDKETLEQPLLLITGENFPSGVLGLAAGRLSEEFRRPVIILSIQDDTAQGSARSIPQFDILSAIHSCREILTRYGGHHSAAGLALPLNRVEELRQRLIQIATTELTGVDLRPEIQIDAELPLQSLPRDIYRWISRLEPFGMGNPEPVFLSRGVKIADCRLIGTKSEHLKFKLRSGNAIWHAVAFNSGHLIHELTPDIDIVYTVEIDHWNGNDTLRLNIIDIGYTI